VDQPVLIDIGEILGNALAEVGKQGVRLEETTRRPPGRRLFKQRLSRMQPVKQICGPEDG